MRFCISIGQLDKSIIYPIIGGFACFISKLIISQTDLANYPIILSVGSTFSMSLSFIFLIIYHFKNNSNNIEVKKERISIKCMYLLLVSFLDFFETIIGNKYCKDVKINLWVFDLLLICLFSFFIFKIKIYSHHFLSIIIIILTSIILDSIEGSYADLFIHKLCSYFNQIYFGNIYII